ncbi:MAG: hypothetical protein WKF90_14260 [Pyrinomonadaceae bacterium]
MRKTNKIWRTTDFKVRQWFVLLFVLTGLIVTALALRPSTSGGIQTVEASTMLTPTVLHFQGNTEEGCTGNGMTDFNAPCNGPLMTTNEVLSTSPAASWTASPVTNTNSDRAAEHTDPNWLWNVPGATRLGGPMTIDWWGSCGACGPTGNADWNIRVWADGVKKFEQRIRATPDLPNVPSLLTTTVFLPEINAATKIVLHIDPVFIDSQQNTRIYYDSRLACPGTDPSTESRPCDSKVTMPVLADGEAVPTPTVTVETVPPPSACALPSYDNYQPPVGMPRRDSAGEPSVGVNWNTGNVLAMARLRPYRASFTDSTSPADPTTGVNWFSVAIPGLVTGFDPILFTDPITGRTIGGELIVAGGSTQGVATDDDLNTISPVIETGGPVQGFDHQTIGGGPPKAGALVKPLGSYPHMVYYASQQIAYATMATSLDGGLTYEPAIPMYTAVQCGGLHGHVKVAPDGTVYLPNKNCGNKAAVIVSEDNGQTFSVRPIPGSSVGRDDPSVAIGAGGRVYVSYTDIRVKPHVVVSDDKGLTWYNDFNVGASIPNLNAAVFPSMVAGDNNRAAVFFLATDSPSGINPTGTDGAPAMGPDPNPIDNFFGTWYPYIATTCDGGKSWSVVRADNDPLRPGMKNPVQQGVICKNGTTCPTGPPNTRNLLDFNDATVDGKGRIIAAYADGCITDACIGLPDHSVDKSGNDGKATLTLIRQRGGMRLFAAFDPVGPAAPSLSPPASAELSSKGDVNLKWATPDDSGSPLTAYRIYRGSKERDAKLVAEIKPDRLSYQNKLLKNDKDVYYYITAVNKLGESPRSVKTFVPKGE